MALLITAITMFFATHFWYYLYGIVRKLLATKNNLKEERFRYVHNFKEGWPWFFIAWSGH